MYCTIGGGLGGTRIGAPHENIKYSGRVDERYVTFNCQFSSSLLCVTLSLLVGEEESNF